jgi:hypothetical protein
MSTIDDKEKKKRIEEIEKRGFLSEYEKEKAEVVTKEKKWFTEDTTSTKNKYDLYKDYLKAINETKKNLMDSDDIMWKKKYNAFMVNRILGSFSDTIMLANEMNRNHSLDRDMQFQFLLNSIKTKKRFTPYLRSELIEDIECVKEYYGYSNDKAKSALDILSKDEINLIKEKLYKGGTK